MGDAVIEVVRDVDQCAVHRCRCEQAGSDELRVGELGSPRAGDRADEGIEPDIDREQEHERLGEPGQEDQPAPAIDEPVPLDEAAGSDQGDHRRNRRASRVENTAVAAATTVTR